MGYVICIRYVQGGLRFCFYFIAYNESCLMNQKIDVVFFADMPYLRFSELQLVVLGIISVMQHATVHFPLCCLKAKKHHRHVKKN